MSILFGSLDLLASKDTTGATSGTGTVSPFRRTCVHPRILVRVRVTRSLVFCVMFCRSVFVLFLLIIVLSVLPRFTASDYLFGIFWSLCCLSFLDLRLLITRLVSSDSSFRLFGFPFYWPLDIPETHHGYENRYLRFKVKLWINQM